MALQCKRNVRSGDAGGRSSNPLVHSPALLMFGLRVISEDIMRSGGGQSALLYAFLR